MFYSPFASACGVTDFIGAKQFAKKVQESERGTQYSVFFAIHNGEEIPNYLSGVTMVLPNIVSTNLDIFESTDFDGYYESSVITLHMSDIENVQFIAPYNYGDKKGESFSLCLPSKVHTLKELLKARKTQD